MKPSSLRRFATTLCLCAGSCAVLAQNPMARSSVDQDRYVSRFEERTRLSYEPQMRFVEQTVSKGSWLPFRKSSKLEKIRVPVVTWVPRLSNEVVPVTDRIARNPQPTTQWQSRPSRQAMSTGPTPQSPTTPRPQPESQPAPLRSRQPTNAIAHDFPVAHKKNHQIADIEKKRQSDGLNTIDRVPTQNPHSRPTGSITPSTLGGIQRLTDDVPRTGMKLRELRY